MNTRSVIRSKPIPISNEELREWDRRMMVNRGTNDDWLNVAGELLWALYKQIDPERRNGLLFGTVTSLQAALEGIIYNWKHGYYLHLEEAFGLKRPRGWHRAAVRKKEEFSHVAIDLVRIALAKGSKTPDVFEEVYESGKLPEKISASLIQKWYYEAKREDPELFPSRLQKKKRISEKKKRS